MRVPSFLRLGVTGGIGSGKSLVCKVFADLGRKVIEADTIARVLVDTDKAIQSQVRNAFGSSVFLPSGKLDRKELARIVFTLPAKRKKLNAIVHPHVFKSIEREIQDSLPESLVPFVVIEAALIYETGMDKELDYILVVNAAEATRIKRVMDRDKVSRDDVVRRMNAQLPVEAKVKKAAFVVENNGTPQELIERIQFINTLLSSLTATKTQ